MRRLDFAAVEHGRPGRAQRFAIDRAQAFAPSRFRGKDIPFAGLDGRPLRLVVVAAMATVGAGHVGMVVLAFQAQGEVMRRQADQHRPAILASRIGAFLVGKDPLVKSRPQFRQRLAHLILLFPSSGTGAPDASVFLALGFRQAMAILMIGHALPADALHIVQRHRHVFGTKVQVDLAPVVAVRFRAPCRAGHAVTDGVILDLRKSGRGVFFCHHALHDLHQRLQARMEGLAVVDGHVLLAHDRILATAEDAARFRRAEKHGRVFHQAVGWVREDQGVGGPLALVEQEGLRQQRDQTALAVRDDGDDIVAVVVADHGNQRRQALGGQHHVHASRRRHQGAYGIAAHVPRRIQTLVPHVGQRIGGVAERAAVLRHVLVQAVAVAVRVLAIDHFAGVALFAKAPVERYHGAVRRIVRLALEKDGVRIGQGFLLVGCLRHAVGGGGEHVAAAIHARVESLAESFFHGAETGAHVVDAMDDDHIAGQFGADAHDGVAAAAAMQQGTVAAADIGKFRIRHRRSLLTRQDSVGRAVGN